MYKAIVVVGILLGAVGSGYLLINNSGVVDDVSLDLFVEPDDTVESWMTVQSFSLDALGEADPGGDGESGFLSIFLLNYTGSDPTTALLHNETDWSAAGNVSAYADADAFSEDTIAGAGFYFVVRVRMNKTHCYDAGDAQFVHTRVRVNLTTSGDETIAGTSGTVIVSQNDSADDFIWLNYYWDDADDGYRVTTDGSITVSEIKIEAKY